MSNRELIGGLFQPRNEKDNEVWNDYLKTITDKILWYPSAGDDLRHFYRIKKDSNDPLFEQTHSVIHSSLDNPDSFSPNNTIKNGQLTININYRIPIEYKFIPSREEKPLKLTKRYSLKTKPIRKTSKPYHDIWLINFNIETPQNGVLNRYVLYFFWDNIILFDLIKKKNIPVNCILSKNDRMDDEKKYRKFWQHFSNCHSINHFICSFHIFNNLNSTNDNVTIISYQNTVLAKLKFLYHYDWDNCGTNLDIYEVLRE